MYFTYVVRPGEAPEGRGPRFEPFWDFLTTFNLRIGFLLQLLAFTGLVICSGVAGNPPFTLLGLLRSRPEEVGSVPVMYVIGCCGLWVLGTLFLLGFLQMADDDSSVRVVNTSTSVCVCLCTTMLSIKQSRGYRAGTKLLLQATSLGIVSWVMTLINFWAANTYFDELWLKREMASGSGWLLFFTGRVADALSLVTYSGAIFFLETFHAEGAGEAWGWIGAILFKGAFVAEILGLTLFHGNGFNVIDTVFTALLGSALIFATLWAFVFEPVSHRYDVKYTQSAMRNEYYKSRNAMAYYGPAVVATDGEIDIDAAAEQAQACLSSCCQ